MVNYFLQRLILSLLTSLCFIVPSYIAWAGEGVRIVRDNAIEIDGKTVILNGVVIPVPTAKCLEGKEMWPCGAAATLRLNEILKNSSIQCESVETSPETLLARCRGSEGDIAEQLVVEGWAISVLSSDEYRDHEQYAKSEGIGIWREGYSPPDSWRPIPKTA